MKNKYRSDKEDLEHSLDAWAGFVPSRVRVVACGGTALTLLGIKDSTKDVDFIVPEEGEYEKLVKALSSIGFVRVTSYGWGRPGDPLIYDLYCGNKVYSTDLLESPLLDGNSTIWKTFNTLEVRILNALDLIVSKMFRGTTVDVQDSLALIRAGAVPDLNQLFLRYRETASYEVQEVKVMKNFEYLLEALREEGLLPREDDES